jgi:splicing factor U2AF subunit
MTQWDVKPIGYEMVTAEQAKLSGMFPLPGAPRQQAVDQSRLAALLAQPGATASASSLLPVNSRASKRLIVTRLPPGVTAESLTEFINLQLNEYVSQPDPCVSSAIPKPDNTWALANFRTPEDTTLALHLAAGGKWILPAPAGVGNGVTNGAAPALALLRPKNYIEPTGAEDEETDARAASIRDSPNKLVITQLPNFIDEEQTRELLRVYGSLKAYSFPKSRTTGESAVSSHDHPSGSNSTNVNQCIALFEYDDPSVIPAAMENLNGMQLGENKLKVAHACVGIKQPKLEMSVQALNVLARGESLAGDRGRVIQLHNMLTADELVDNEDYQGMSSQLPILSY